MNGRDHRCGPQRAGEARAIGVRDDRFEHGGPRPAVRAGSAWGRVGFDDTAGALAVDDPHQDGPWLRAGELGDHRDRRVGRSGMSPRRGIGRAPRGRRRSGRGAEHLQLGERVRVKPCPVPRVHPVGDDVDGFAYPRQRGDGGDLRTVRASAEDRRRVGSSPPTPSKPDPYQHAVVEGGQRTPSRMRCRRSAEGRATGRRAAPTSTTPVHRSAPRCGHVRDRSCGWPSDPRQHTSSAPATLAPNGFDATSAARRDGEPVAAGPAL